MSMGMLYGWLFAAGLLMGSFLNVTALRYKPGEPVFGLRALGGRSRCLHCRKSLRWYELVPVLSWLIQGGRCRRCQGKISWRYPLVELATGAVTAGVPYVLGEMFFIRQTFLSGGEIGWFITISVLWIWVFYMLILTTLIDWERMIIPDEINLTLFILGGLIISWQWWYEQFNLAAGTFLGGYAAMLGWRVEVWSNHVIAALAAGGLFWLIVALSRGRGMGWGDVKLAAVLGWVFGWPDVLLVIMLAFMAGGVVGMFKILMDKKSAKLLIPFGPFLALAAITVFAAGEAILRAYFELFGIV